MDDTHSVDVVYGYVDMFVTRLTSSGDVLWVKTAGGPDIDKGLGIAALEDGSAVVSGRFCESAVFGEGETNETELDAGDAYETSCASFLAVYSASGGFEWARISALHCIARAIATAPDGSIYLAGEFSLPATFGLGDPDEVTIEPCEDHDDTFLAKFDATGDFIWVAVSTGDDSEYARGIDVRADGSVAITGEFRGTAVFGEGEENETTLPVTTATHEDLFVAVYSSSGELVWARSAGGDDNDVATDVAAYTDGSLVVVGAIDGNAIFGLGEPNETLLLSSGKQDTFIAKYQEDGDLEWARAEIGSGTMNSLWGRSIDVIDDGDFFVAGIFNTEATFGKLEPNETTLYASGGDGDDDGFLARYSP
jgi:hypothetical protein